MLERIVNKYRQYPLALTGCRARAKDLAYDVCEYNILLLEDASINNTLQHYDSPSIDSEGNASNGTGRSRKGLDGHTDGSMSSSGSSSSSDEYIYMDDGSIARIHRIDRDTKMVEKVMLLDGMIILNDVNSRLSMLEAKMASISRRVKKLHARSLMADVLFYASNAIHARDAVEASFWLRSAACSYMEAHILSNGSVPMPSHILAQIRALSDTNISAITECLGLEQANRSSTARAMRALIHVLALFHCSKLAMTVVRKKLEYLSSMGMYTDAYTYICYICSKLVEGKGISMGSIKHLPAYDMLSIAMNLSSDHLSTSRLADTLLSICKARLNAY
ncbi:MAG: hypothetical protein QW572_01370 [Candidatus Nitrosocaldus sp.]